MEQTVAITEGINTDSPQTVDTCAELKYADYAQTVARKVEDFKNADYAHILNFNLDLNFADYPHSFFTTIHFLIVSLNFSSSFSVFLPCFLNLIEFSSLFFFPYLLLSLFLLLLFLFS